MADMSMSDDSPDAICSDLLVTRRIRLRRIPPGLGSESIESGGGGALAAAQVLTGGLGGTWYASRRTESFAAGRVASATTIRRIRKVHHLISRQQAARERSC